MPKSATIPKNILFGFLLGVAILIVDAAVPLLLAQSNARMRADADEAEATHDRLQELLSAYKDAETGQRGYMLGATSEFLEPYTKGRAAIGRLLPQLESDLRNDAHQQDLIRRLVALDAEQHAFQEQRIAARAGEHWFDPAASAHGKQLMDSLRQIIEEMGQLEREHARLLLDKVQRFEGLARLSIGAITLADLALFGYVFAVALRALAAQRKTSVALAGANTDLTGEIALRTEVMRRLEQQAAQLNEIVRTQTTLAEAQLDVGAFMAQIVERIIELTPAQGAVIEMPEGDEMLYSKVGGTTVPFAGFRVPRAGSLSGLCIERAEVLIAVDTRTDPRVDRAACERIGAGTMVVAPLLQNGTAIGVLKIVAAEPGVFDADAVRTLQLMAGFLGAALGNQVQFERNRKLLAERSATLAVLERELRRREEYEARLLRQRERTEAILETSNEAFISIDRDGRVAEWNAQAATMFGWSKEEALDYPLEELIVPERFHAAHTGGLAHFLETGEGPVLNRRIELPARSRDGREIPIELTISVLRDGDRIEFPAFLRDIGDRKRAEAAIISQRETLEAVTNAIPALVSLIDRDGRYLFCNDEYEAIFGAPVEQIVGRSIHEFASETAYSEMAPHVARALAGETVVYERTLMTPGGMRHQECRHIPQFNAIGEVDGFYLVAWDVTERKAQEIEWQSRASIDQLTGLVNRAFFLDALTVALSQHRHRRQPLAVLYLDVDRFKHINDSYGHAAGDALLQAFAGYLKASVRDSDVVGRFGGDEFCILLDNIKSEDNARVVAEKILEAARVPVAFEQHTLAISTSIGIAYCAHPELKAETLIARADAALYRAKQAGRNRYAVDVMDAVASA